MKVSTEPKPLELRWVPVVDARGRERLEARWVPAGTAPVTAHHAA
ncbi:hypothetical protein AB3X52_09230 [Nocardioides sp. DS6]|uniref:NUDIX hydrolase n=1 Tax=Nocardioides eburneus TaxID=3231482 RepID=A0ABV3SZ30_9ACTN